MNSIDDIMKGGISAILIAVGYVLLWCAVLCLIGSATGMAEEGIRMCGVGCLVFGAIQMSSGIAWYYIAKQKA